MKTIYILRDLFFDQQASLGTCIVRNEECERVFKGVSLERGWIDNQNNISCIPVGEYAVKLEWSPRFNMELWEIYGVEGRSECKFHAANYWTDLNGCIGLGKYEDNIDGDPVMDIAHSKVTMKRFHKAMGGDTEARLIVMNLFDII
jgi:hypothetical protein